MMQKASLLVASVRPVHVQRRFYLQLTVRALCNKSTQNNATNNDATTSGNNNIPDEAFFGAVKDEGRNDQTRLARRPQSEPASVSKGAMRERLKPADYERDWVNAPRTTHEAINLFEKKMLDRYDKYTDPDRKHKDEIEFTKGHKGPKQYIYASDARRQQLIEEGKVEAAGDRRATHETGFSFGMKPGRTGQGNLGDQIPTSHHETVAEQMAAAGKPMHPADVKFKQKLKAMTTADKERPFGEYEEDTALQYPPPQQDTIPVGFESTAAKVLRETRAGESKVNYIRSRDFFGEKTIANDRPYSGANEEQEITWWEKLYFNWIRYPINREVIVGKDRYGTIFTARYSFMKERYEARFAYRKDPEKRFTPYGQLPTDDRLWESWLRRWRSDPPTPEESEVARHVIKSKMGAFNLGNEDYEDAVVRVLAHAPGSDTLLGDTDKDGKYTAQSLGLQNSEDRNIIDRRLAEGDPVHEAHVTWTGSFVRGDIFYNEEEHEILRTGLSAMYRDREWQALEVKRQARSREAPWTTNRPAAKDHKTGELWAGTQEPPKFFFRRSDNGIPFDLAVPDLTTPELEKLRAECEGLEQERLAIRKELGLTDLGDVREGRGHVLPDDPTRGPFQPPPTSKRWKPQCWQETWGSSHEKGRANSVFGSELNSYTSSAKI